MAGEDVLNGPKVPRFGSQGFGRSKLIGPAFDTDGAAPTIRAEGVKIDRFTEAQWVVSMPSWCTGYDVHFLRYVEVFNADGGEIFGKWVEDEAVNATADLVYYQFITGQRVAAYIDGILGVPDAVEFFRLVLTGTNKGV